MAKRPRYLTKDEIAALLLESDDSETDDNVEIDEDVDDSDVDPDYIPDDAIKNDSDSMLESPIQEIECSRSYIHELGKKERNHASKVEKPSKSGQNKKSTNDREKSGQDCVIVTIDSVLVKGKNEYEWSTITDNNINLKTSAKNIVHIRPGPVADARIAKEPIDCFNLFISHEIIQEILTHTNSEINRKKIAYSNDKDGSLKDINYDELNALLGIFILTAALKDNHLSTKLMFDVTFCGERYRATFSERRFSFLLDCLRFDCKETREVRKEADKLAAIRQIWDVLIENCKKNYKPSSYVTIDEQLIGFRGKCPFRMYIPSKPNKYGIKVLMICDNGTKYMMNAIPYLGKGSVPKGIVAADYFVDKLTETIKTTNRNVTMDNWFSNVPLAEKMLKEDKLTMVGTIKKNKREFPQEFTDAKYKERKNGSSLYLFHDDITAVSYKAKKKLVTLISTMHSNSEVNQSTGKPEIIMTYNSTKGGVDSFDQLCNNMNCGRKTKRWPMAFFYNMINIAGINAYVIYLHNFYRNRESNEMPLSRLQFMLKLHQQLCEKFQRQRLSTPNLSRDLKVMITKALGEDIQDAEVAQNQQGRRTYCRFCDYKKKRMTTTYCKCGKAICGQHQKKSCPNCI